ncbi:MAG: hypothetical protein QOH92_1873 [Chloroflexota bacterium]|nr:hypothetical protein [Chloroflexota bacterium]
MVERLRRALGYGPAPWLNTRRVQAALGLLSLWAVGTMTYGLWSAATVHQPSPDQIDSFLASLLMPGLVLPAILLAWLGSRLAWALIVAFEGLDVVNNLDSVDGLVFHLALAVLVILATIVVWRFRRAGLPVAPPRVAAWKRINLFTVVAAALLAFAAFSATAGYAAHHGNLPQLTPAVSMLVAAIAWTGSVLLAVSLWKRLPFLLWAFGPAVFIIGFAFMSAACPGCTWASH